MRNLSVPTFLKEMPIATTHERAAVLAIVLIAAIGTLTPQQLHAQNSANASVSADVQQPLAVTKTNDLAFGSVFPGLNKTVAVTDAGAAAFTVLGQAGASVNLTFSTPTTLASGGNSLTVGTWAARRNTSNSSASGTDFTPSGSATSATIGGGGGLYVFVGATVQPTSGQVAGTYTGTLTLTVVYF